MANYCMNSLTLEGETAALREFKELAAGVSADPAEGPCPLDFRRHAPLPDPPVQGAAADAAAAWGTKWLLDASDITVDDRSEAGVMVYEFATAWEPPTEWLKAAAALHPDVSFMLTYGEGGNMFVGELELTGGDVDVDVRFDGDDAVAYIRDQDLEWLIPLPEDDE